MRLIGTAFILLFSIFAGLTLFSGSGEFALQKTHLVFTGTVATLIAGTFLFYAVRGLLTER